MIEALLYLLSIAEASRKGTTHANPLPKLQLGGSVVFAVDASYIVNILLGRTVARENVEIIRLMKHLWQHAKLYYKMNIVWVKGHSGHAGKDLADHLAVSAGMADGKDIWWERNFLLSDWGQADYINLCTSYFPSTATDTQSSPKRRKGMAADGIGYVNFNMQYPPFDSLLSEDLTSLPPNHPDERLNYDGSFTIPTISTFTKTLYDTAAIFGRGNSNFPRNSSKTTTTCLWKERLSTPDVWQLRGANVRTLGTRWLADAKN